MESIAISDLKARLSEYLRRVKGGERLLITDRGTPVAIVSPLEGDELTGGMNDLIDQGLVRPPEPLRAESGPPEQRPSDPTGQLARAVAADRESGW